MPRHTLTVPTLLAVLAAAGCRGELEPVDEEQVPIPQAPELRWRPLFDGESLDGWTPKFAGHPVGENVRDTFRVEDGLLKVSYDDYESFDGLFGHLFFEGEFERYEVRAVYRFVGDQCPGAPGWAFRNNGLMLHGQTPESMGLDQNFPVSIEAQMLGQVEGGGERANGGVCTPGTLIEVDGEVTRSHCVPSDGPTSRGDGWVTMTVRVEGAERVRHYVDEVLVHDYGGTQLDPGDGDARRLIAAGADLTLERGTISIQAESHPIEFRSIDIRVLDGE